MGAIPNIEVRDSLISGRELFATALITKGSTVLSWNPKVLAREEADKLSNYERKHYLVPEGEMTLWMQPPERYVNHSCEPNTHVVGRSDVALRDIQPSEEITSDYMGEGTESFKCHCGSASCRKPA